MDLHLALVYDNQIRNCEVFYSNPLCAGSILDTDSQNGHGPETISIQKYERNILYVVYVYNYAHSHDHPLTLSEGRVSIGPYGKNSTIVEVPSSSNDDNQRFWIIGCFHSEVGLENIKIVNKLVDQSPSSHTDFCSLNDENLLK